MASIYGALYAAGQNQVGVSVFASAVNGQGYLDVTSSDPAFPIQANVSGAVADAVNGDEVVIGRVFHDDGVSDTGVWENGTAQSGILQVFGSVSGQTVKVRFTPDNGPIIEYGPFPLNWGAVSA